MAEEDENVVDLSAENTNKKTTYFVVDGSEEMFLDDPSGMRYGADCSFMRAIKAIYATCAHLCATEEALKHLVGILVINTTFTEVDPDIAMGAENMKHIFTIGVLDNEKVLMLEDLLKTDDLEQYFMENFGGHTRCNYQKVASYSKLNISYSSTSRRFTSWIHFTNQVNPFKKNFAYDDEYKRMVRNLLDIEGRRPAEVDSPRRPLRGKCTVFVLGDPEKVDESELVMWRSIDDEANVYNKDLETNIIRKTGAVRAHSVIPFMLGPGLEFNVAVYSLVVSKLKPTPFAVHAKTGAAIKSVTSYVTRPESDEQAETSQGTPMEVDEKADVKTALSGAPLQRHQLLQTRDVGGETIVLTQGDRDIHYRYPKGLRLVEFRPLSEIDLWEHVSSPWVIRPHDASHTGATSLYSHLLERMEKREVVAICEYTGRANQKPRNVALIPNSEHDPQEGVHRGFLIVELHDPDDKLDIEAAFEEKMKPPESLGKWLKPNRKAVDAAKNICSTLLKKRFTPTAYPNPHLQAFYTMIKREANLDTPDNESEEWTKAMQDEWDQIRPWFDNKSMPSARFAKVENAASELGQETGTLDWDPKATAKKRIQKDDADGDEEPKKKGKVAKNNGSDAVNLEEMASDGNLSKLTVAVLKEQASAAGINLKHAKKKEEIVEAICQHYMH